MLAWRWSVVVPLLGLGGTEGSDAAPPAREARLDLLLTLAIETVERDVVRLRYGLDDGNSKTFSAVASIVSLSTRQVRTVESNALEALRRPHFISRLEEFLDLDL